MDQEQEATGALLLRSDDAERVCPESPSAWRPPWWPDDRPGYGPFLQFRRFGLVLSINLAVVSITLVVGRNVPCMTRRFR